MRSEDLALQTMTLLPPMQSWQSHIQSSCVVSRHTWALLQRRSNNFRHNTSHWSEMMLLCMIVLTVFSHVAELPPHARFVADTRFERAEPEPPSRLPSYVYDTALLLNNIGKSTEQPMLNSSKHGLHGLLRQELQASLSGGNFIGRCQLQFQAARSAVAFVRKWHEVGRKQVPEGLAAQVSSSYQVSQARGRDELTWHTFTHCLATKKIDAG